MPPDLKSIRYGTQYFPSTRKVPLKGPDPAVFKSTSIFTRSAQATPKEIHAQFPTFSVLDSCVGDKRALLKWQKDKIDMIGKQSLVKWMTERTAVGRRFHKAVEDSLEANKRQQLPSLDELLSKSDATTHGYIQSVYPFIKSLPAVDCIQEEPIVHHDLYYKGRFDAVLMHSGGPCLIDWKTTSERSAVATNYGKGDGLKGLFGYPRQVAAYIGAINSDPTFAHLPPIQRGTIVIAFDSGAEATVLDISRQDLEALWAEWLNDLQTKFWQPLEAGEWDFCCTWEKVYKK